MLLVPAFVNKETVAWTDSHRRAQIVWVEKDKQVFGLDSWLPLFSAGCGIWSLCLVGMIVLSSLAPDRRGETLTPKLTGASCHSQRAV